jgi:hypothetical protein
MSGISLLSGKLHRGIFSSDHDKDLLSSIDTILNGSDQDLIDLIALAFEVRDVLQGDGNRKYFFMILRAVYEKYPGLVESLIRYIPAYGTWKDVFVLAEFVPKTIIFNVAAMQLEEDERNIIYNRPISLLAKWAPREGKEFHYLAVSFAYYLAGRVNAKHSQMMKAYRRRMARLNLAMMTVETLECSRRWDEINPARVPTTAFKRKLAAYLNETSLGAPREPNNIRRNQCRENFLTFLNTRHHTPPRYDETRYNPIRAAVREWIEGGWRGT